MAEGKINIKNKLIKPFELLRKNKNDKEKTNEIATNKNVTTQTAITNEYATNQTATTNENATNERREEAPFDNLLKNLEKLEIDKKARLEASKAFNNDADSICDSDGDIDKELQEKFDTKARKDVTPANNKQDNENYKEIQNKFDNKAINDDSNDAELLDKFNELEIEKKEVSIDEDEEELKKFSTKIVSDDARALRIDSQSSEDCGFTDKCFFIESDKENLDKDVDRIEEKGGEDDKKEGAKQKKLHKAYLRRGPIKNKRSQTPASAPYPCEINLNLHYSGGQVINSTDHPIQPHLQNFIEASTQHHSKAFNNDADSICDSDGDIDKELQEKFDKKARNDATPANNKQDNENDKEIENKFENKAINDDSNDAELLDKFNELEIEKKEVSIDEDEEELKKFSTKIVSDDARALRIDSQSSEDCGFTDKCFFIESDKENLDKDVDRIEEKGGEDHPIQPHLQNFIEASTQHQIPQQNNDLPNEIIDISSYLTPEEINTCCSILQNGLPQNRNMESPFKGIHTFSESDVLSWIEELEEFKDIVTNDQILSPLFDAQIKENTPIIESSRLYKNMKQYMDRIRELAKEFSGMQCCQIILKPCKEIFNEHLQKLPDGDRRKWCYTVANLELKSAFDVLIHTLSDLSKSDQAEDLKMALFCLVCEKVLSTQKTLFIDDFGLNLLQFAVLRCYERPVITRYLVQCIRVVTRSAEYQCPNKTVFTEVDSKGDNLLIACVRAGDKCANVLRELVRGDENDVPLFDVHHVNTDGYTALHVCCGEHSASAPRAHTLHVLLQHAGAQRDRQDRKGGETPLHLAVNSVNCSLDMILIYFQHIDRREWYNLAHMKNSSGKNPLEYAKFGKKSRANYPREILDFLERCRK